MWRSPAPGSNTTASPTLPVGRTILAENCLKMNEWVRKGRSFMPCQLGPPSQWQETLGLCSNNSDFYPQSGLHSTCLSTRGHIIF